MINYICVLCIYITVIYSMLYYCLGDFLGYHFNY